MEEPPEFLADPPSDLRLGTYRPTLASRRGELIAWLSALGTGVGTAILALRLGQLPSFGLGLTLFLIFVSILISFGGWMERNTALTLREDGIHYRSPVRDVEMGWDEIVRLRAEGAGRGWKIRVEGREGQFSFRTASSLRLGTYDEMPLGFSEGERLAGIIRSRAELSPPARGSGGWDCASGRDAAA